MTVWWWKLRRSRQGFAEHCEKERCHGREREAPGAVVRLPSLPPLYIGPLGGASPWEIRSPRGAAAKGGGVPPKPSGAPPPLGFPTLGTGEAQGGRTSPLGAGSPPTSAHGALRDRWPHPVDPRDPSGGPGTIPVTPETFPMAETRLPIYNSLPPDHYGTLHDVWGLIRDSEQLSVCCILISLKP